MTILETIYSPENVKTLKSEELKQLAEEIRAAILNKVSQVSGHVGPNLGVTELTIAYHYVFQSPKDKIVWDVSHQAYPHKMLTGRQQNFTDETQFHDISGYTSPDESEHDFFKIGHTSTSISLAVGLAKARDLKKQTGNVIAVIGDGSLSGGLAFEGLNNGAELDSNLIIVVNDNEMSIDNNIGGLYKTLAELRQSNGTAENNFFKAMGFDYRYVEDGNNIEAMIHAFQELKDINHPIVLHVHTEKGHGFQKAVDNKMLYHWRTPFDLETGEALSSSNEETYAGLVIDYLNNRITQGDTEIAAINAAIPGMFGLKKLEAVHPDHYFDVGIAEGHSISFAAGLAKSGVKPVVFHSSYFLPRAYDQLSHDLAINKLPAVVIVANGHITESSATHQGIFDIPMISSIPEFNYLAPTSKEELLAMLDWSLAQEKVPIAIRLPAGKVLSKAAHTKEFAHGKYELLQRGNQIAILALGTFLPLGSQTQALLEEKLGHPVTLINPQFITRFDYETLESLKEDHTLLLTLEDGSLSGGFGEKIAAYYGNSSMKVLSFGAEKEFTDNVSLQVLNNKYHLTPEQIAEDALNQL